MPYNTTNLFFPVRVILDDLIVEALHVASSIGRAGELQILAFGVLRDRQPGPDELRGLDPVLEMIRQHDSTNEGWRDRRIAWIRSETLDSQKILGFAISS